MHCEIKFSITKMIFKCIFTVSSFVYRLQKVYGRVRVWLRLFEGLERLMVCLFMGLRRSVDSLLLGSPLCDLFLLWTDSILCSQDWRNVTAVEYYLARKREQCLERWLSS